MRRRALLSVLAVAPLAGCSVTEELALTDDSMRIPREDRLTIVSRADNDLSIRFVITHTETNETWVDNTQIVTPGRRLSFADALPRRGSAMLVIDVDGGTRFERDIHDYESVTIEIRDAETVAVTEQVEV